MAHDALTRHDLSTMDIETITAHLIQLRDRRLHYDTVVKTARARTNRLPSGTSRDKLEKKLKRLDKIRKDIEDALITAEAILVESFGLTLQIEDATLADIS